LDKPSYIKIRSLNVLLQPNLRKRSLSIMTTWVSQSEIN